MSEENKTGGNADITKTGESQQQKSGSASEGAEKSTQDQPKKKEFTQEELTRMMTKEKRQGRSAALKELGIDPKDEKAIERIKALIEGTKTPEQKAVDKKVNESTAIEEAERRAVLAEAKVEAMRLGVQPQFVNDTITLITAKMGDGDDLKTLIGELKIKYPGWFEIDNKDGKTNEVGKKGTGSTVKSNGQGGSEGKGLGERLAAMRKEGQSKSQFWK